MTRRAGTSFVEVLVAAVLLAIGIVGCLSTLAAAARLRHGASIREDLAARAHDRLDWSFARGCVVGDTSFASAPGALVQESWSQRRDSTGARLTLDLSARSSAKVHRVRLVAERPCP
jgi:hypothetical protein